MLFLHETHEIIGGQTPAFEAAVRDQWRPLIEAQGTARLLWFWHLTHGTGRHHAVVLLQRVLDWPAYANMLSGGERPTKPGDWMEEGLKYRDRWESKLLRPASWSPWQ